MYVYLNVIIICCLSSLFIVSSFNRFIVFNLFFYR